MRQSSRGLFRRSRRAEQRVSEEFEPEERVIPRPTTAAPPEPALPLAVPVAPPPEPRFLAGQDAPSAPGADAIGIGTSFEGIYRSTGSITIRGVAGGEIESASTVVVEAGASVSGRLTAAEIIISGEIDGDLCASGRIELRSTAQVTGTINSGVIVMVAGASFNGRLTMSAESQVAESDSSAAA